MCLYVMCIYYIHIYIYIDIIHIDMIYIYTYVNKYIYICIHVYLHYHTIIHIHLKSCRISLSSEVWMSRLQSSSVPGCLRSLRSAVGNRIRLQSCTEQTGTPRKPVWYTIIESSLVYNIWYSMVQYSIVK